MMTTHQNKYTSVITLYKNRVKRVKIGMAVLVEINDSTGFQFKYLKQPFFLCGCMNNDCCLSDAKVDVP